MRAGRDVRERIGHAFRIPVRADLSGWVGPPVRELIRDQVWDPVEGRVFGWAKVPVLDQVWDGAAAAVRASGPPVKAGRLVTDRVRYQVANDSMYGLGSRVRPWIMNWIEDRVWDSVDAGMNLPVGAAALWDPLEEGEEEDTAWTW